MTPARTTSELATLLKLSERRTLELVQDSADLGLVEEEDGRWRLSAHAEWEFGNALRARDNSIEDRSSFARASYPGEPPA